MNKLTVKITRVMKQDLNRMARRGKDLVKLDPIILSLVKDKALDSRYRDHALKGSWYNYRECHIEPDWLLIYKISSPFLYLVRTGTHSDLFKQK